MDDNLMEQFKKRYSHVTITLIPFLLHRIGENNFTGANKLMPCIKSLRKLLKSAMIGFLQQKRPEKNQP